MRGLLHGIFILIVINLVNSEDSRRLLISSVKKYGVDHFQFVEVGAGTDNLGDLPFISMALFDNYLTENGWNVLSVVTSDKFPDIYQAYWAGFLETNATYELTVASWKNTVEGLCAEPLSADCQKLQSYLSANLKYVISAAIILGRSDPFWHQIYLQMWQLKGISDAYKQIFVENSTIMTPHYIYSLTEEVLGIYLLQLSGDLSEILQALSLNTLVNGVNRFGVRWVASPTCSALVKLTHDNVYLSHVTWAPYTSMLRVLKHYNFPWNMRGQDKQQIPGYAITFSSYPSTISSIDDFYVISSKLVTIETTIGNSNNNLWAIVRDGAGSSVLEPFRVMAANRLANNGNEWVSYFRQRNSGTYNNQWMVFDANLYSPGVKTLNKGLLTVAEQLPGIVKAEDVTHVLEQQTYWPSYNLAYFPLIYNLSGMPEKLAKYGDWYDYQKTARANIFRRDHAKVENMATMHRLMRYNDFTHDEYSQCACNPPYTAENGISSRSDLNAPNGTYPIPAFEYRIHGGTDVKIVDFALIHQMNMVATSGPTYDDLPPFEWSKLPVPVPRPYMHPDKWMFKPIMTNFPDYTVTPQPKLPTLLKVFPETA
ncbi:hypothetical protein CRM22_004468 [Opisthorchis felineus]|uniref:Phospholipase B-like n=1 Tax=Opisthorchis felineus TaxID=147828 RepID=A0A4S2LWV5_OPIFE|nr:hypothetical protein CRM22_004468 [Opisthorchis felineus]